MKAQQIWNIVNTIASEVTGKSDLVAEDLHNVVDVGKEVLASTDVDNYVKKLVDRIGKVVFVDRDYRGIAPKVLMDAWEFGSIVEKIQMDLPVATENPSWNLTNGQSYDPNIFYQPTVTAKFFNNKSTFEIPMSFTEMQVKESFTDATQLNAFLSMIYSMIARAMTVRTDSMIQRTINNMIAQTVAHDFADVTDYSAKTSTRAVNLLYLYNQANSTTLTAEQALTTPEFIRFASYQMGLYVDRLRGLSTLFNCGGKERFTSRDLLHIVMLSDFARAADMYLYSDTFHNDLVQLPNYESIPFWQASGKDYNFANTSKINVTTASADGDAGKPVTIGGIVGIMFDRDALGVTNYNERVTSNYNAKAEFFNNFYKYDCGYFNDLNENFVMFFMA